MAQAPQHNHNSNEQYGRGQHASDDPNVARKPHEAGCVLAELVGAEQKGHATHFATHRRLSVKQCRSYFASVPAIVQ